MQGRNILNPHRNRRGQNKPLTMMAAKTRKKVLDKIRRIAGTPNGIRKTIPQGNQQRTGETCSFNDCVPKTKVMIQSDL